MITAGDEEDVVGTRHRLYECTTLVQREVSKPAAGGNQKSPALSALRLSREERAREEWHAGNRPNSEFTFGRSRNGGVDPGACAWDTRLRLITLRARTLTDQHGPWVSVTGLRLAQLGH